MEEGRGGRGVLSAIDLDELSKYEWIGSPPDPWLDHFKAPIKTLYCDGCDKWVIPPDSVILWTVNLFRCTRGEFDEERGGPAQVPVTCPDCNEELIIKPENYDGALEWVWWRHTLVPVNAKLGVSPLFYVILMEKINAGKSLQVVFDGRAGEGKTYFMLKLAQILNPFMGIEQIIFTRDEFIKMVNTAKPKTVVCVDETSYIGGKRSWQNPRQQELLLIWESMRFKLLPVFSTVINISLLDKTIREQLVVFQVHMLERGKARAYEIRPHPLKSYVGRKRIQTIYLPLPDANFCARPSCLLPACRDLDRCPLLRGSYERKKRAIQNKRYKEAEETAETATLTITDWLERFLEVREACIVDVGGKKKFDRELIELELGCSGSMAQRVRSLAMRRDEETLRSYIEKARARGA